MKNENIEDNFAILRNLYKNSNFSLRDLVSELDLSIRKLNYCIKVFKNIS